jgi:hypothetical protein
MTKMTPEQEAAYALDYDVDRDSLSPAAQAEYDRLKRERVSRPRVQAAAFTSAGAGASAGTGASTARHAFMSGAAQERVRPSQGRLPLTIAGRSPVDGTRLRWAGAGNLLLGLGCIFGAGGGGGIFFGIVFLALGAATIILTRFGTVPWHHLSKNVKPVVATGAAVGLAWLCFFLFWLFILWVAAKTVLKWMAE